MRPSRCSFTQADAVITVPFTVAKTAKPGKTALAGALSFQGCDAKSCYPAGFGPGAGGGDGQDEKHVYLGLLALLFLLLTTSAGAGTPRPVHFTASASPSPARAGEAVTVTVRTTTVDPGWHVYSVIPAATGSGDDRNHLLGRAATPVGPTTEDAPIQKFDPKLPDASRLPRGDGDVPAAIPSRRDSREVGHASLPDLQRPTSACRRPMWFCRSHCKSRRARRGLNSPFLPLRTNLPPAGMKGRRLPHPLPVLPVRAQQPQGVQQAAPLRVMGGWVCFCWPPSARGFWPSSRPASSRSFPSR